MKLKSILTASLMGALLVGCGGGGGGGETPPEQNPAQPTSAIDKYVGTWVGVCETFAGGSELEVVTLTKTSDTIMSLSGIEQTFTSANCSGNSVNSNFAGTYRFDGVKTIGTETADKFTITSLTPNEKLLIKVSGTQIFAGDESAGAPIDAEGYPDRLEATAAYNKQ